MNTFFSLLRLRLLPLGAFIAVSLPSAGAADLPALWTERIKSVVAVEYVTVTEVDRRPTIAMGTVVDRQGTIVLPGSAIDPRTAISQLKEFKVHLPGEAIGEPAEYLGPDSFTGWHFVRASEKLRSQLVPVTEFVQAGHAAPGLSDFVWGIGLRGKEEDFVPYIMQSNVALTQSLPQRTGISQHEVAGPGLPVFHRDGAFAGLATSSFGQSFLQFSRSARGNPVVLVNVEESSVFWLADEAVPYFGRIPRNASGRPLAWLGAYGLEPMDREVAKFLNLSAASGAVVSEVLEASPAEKAGLRDRDIILAVDGRPLPTLKPDRVVVAYLEREVDRRTPGDVMTLTVLRGTEWIELKATLGEQPKIMREADRKHFERLGFTARELVYGDAIERRVKASEAAGVIVNYVKPGSPAATAGLRLDDWIKEVDGTETRSFAAAVERLAGVERDQARPEAVLLVARGNETAVLRVKLK